VRILLVIILLSNLLFSDHGEQEPYKKNHEGIHMPYDMHYLNLSQKQQKKIRHLFKSSRDKHKKLYKKVERTERTLAKLFDQTHFDKERFVMLQLQLKREALQIEAELLEDIHTILTQKQRKQFVHYLKEWEID